MGRRSLAFALAAGLGYALAHRAMTRHGATAEEIERPFPGAALVPGGRRTTTMATTIDAPPRDVWPWLAQMGCDRGGWYSWDRLDNGGRPSAETLNPEWQGVAAGDRMLSLPSGASWFEVAAAERPHFLALRAPVDLRGRPFDTGRERPSAYSDSLWAFDLREAPGERTRLVVSGYAALRPRMLLRIADLLFWDPAHWVMQRRQFAGLRRRVRRGDAQVAAGGGGQIAA